MDLFDNTIADLKYLREQVRHTHTHAHHRTRTTARPHRTPRYRMSLTVKWSVRRWRPRSPSRWKTAPRKRRSTSPRYGSRTGPSRCRTPNVPRPRKLPPIVCACDVRVVSCVFCGTQGNLNSFKELDARISGVGNIAVRIGTSVCGDVDEVLRFSAARNSAAERDTAQVIGWRPLKSNALPRLKQRVCLPRGEPPHTHTPHTHTAHARAIILTPLSNRADQLLHRALLGRDQVVDLPGQEATARTCQAAQETERLHQGARAS